MQTAYDWITLIIFGGLIVLFLERSAKPEPSDHLWQYLVPAVGCALADYAGNHDQPVAAIAIILGTLVYIHLVLEPFGAWPQR